MCSARGGWTGRVCFELRVRREEIMVFKEEAGISDGLSGGGGGRRWGRPPSVANGGGPEEERRGAGSRPCNVG